MNPKMPKLDESKLTFDQRDKLDAYNATQQQLTTLQDIADMTQEMVNILDDQGKSEEKTDKSMGALLMDMRDSLNALNAKEAPELPDTAKPVVDAIDKLQAALATQIKAIELKPVINAPQVNVEPSPVDLKGIEKILKTDIPNAFQAAIKLIPPPEKDDNTELLQAWAGISEQLQSIDTATRLKPQPGNMKVSNLDGSQIGSTGLIPYAFDRITFTNADGNGNYQTGTVKKSGSTIGTLTLAYDGSSNLTDIHFT